VIQREKDRKPPLFEFSVKEYSNMQIKDRKYGVEMKNFFQLIDVQVLKYIVIEIRRIQSFS